MMEESVNGFGGLEVENDHHAQFDGSLHSSTSAKINFDLDDAFSAGDDDDAEGLFDLSAASLRQELARQEVEEQDYLEQEHLPYEETATPSERRPSSSFEVSPDRPPSPGAQTWATVSTLELEPPQSPPEIAADSSYATTRGPNFEPTQFIEIPAQELVPPAQPSPEWQSPAYQLPAAYRQQSPSPTSPSAPDPPRQSNWPPQLASPKTASFAENFRPTPTHGPSALEKVMSKTRPSHLPPKPREEDQKHLKEWEIIMERSREAGELRKAAILTKRLAREQAVEESIGRWEKEVTPNWRVVRKNPRLRKLWWKGIPTKLRGTLWEQAIGNDLALSKDNYKICLARAKRALSAKTFPKEPLQLIEEDISNTLPTLQLFNPNAGPMYSDLKDLLCAWTVARSDEGLGYMTGASKIGAMLLINMAPTPAFITMRNLLERHCLRVFYSGSQDDIEAYYRIFDTLLADSMPKVYFNFKQHQISPSEYLPAWLSSLFLEHIPFEACARIWDVLALEGDSFMFRTALAILEVMESRLFFPDRAVLIDILRGEDKAALEVTKRNSAIQKRDKGQDIDLGARYEVYGLTVESLWERIESMEETWKDTTWLRLTHRELPDL